MPQKRLPNPYPVNNPKILFQEAEAFLRSIEGIKYEKEKMEPNYEMGVYKFFDYVILTNHAFPFELYLKCLMAIENGKAYRGHDLYELFLKISKANRQRIIERHAEIKSPTTIITILMTQRFEFDFESIL